MSYATSPRNSEQHATSWCVWCFKEGHTLHRCKAYQAEALTAEEKVAAKCAQKYAANRFDNESKAANAEFFSLDALETFLPDDFQIHVWQCDEKQQFSFIAHVFDNVFVFENVCLEKPLGFIRAWELPRTSKKHIKLQQILSACIYQPFSTARLAKNVESAKSYLDAVQQFLK